METYKELENDALCRGVDPAILCDVNDFISRKSLPSSILALENNANTDDYFTDEATKIQREWQRLHPAVPSGSGEPPVLKEPISIGLRINCSTPLGSEADVDAYLERLKSQLMKLINDGESIIVL